MARVQKKRSERSAAHADRRLTEIKEVAAKWFFLKGYEGTDLRAIAGDLDMHAGSLYNYIRSKEELLYLIMKEALEDQIRRFNESIDSTADPVEKLRAALEAYVQRHVLLKEITFSSEVEIRALTGHYRDEIVELRRRYESLWLQIVEEGVQAGAFRSFDVRVTVYAMLSLPWSLPLWYKEHGRLSLEEVSLEYQRLVLHGLVRPRADHDAAASDGASGDPLAAS